MSDPTHNGHANGNGHHNGTGAGAAPEYWGQWEKISLLCLAVGAVAYAVLAFLQYTAFDSSDHRETPRLFLPYLVAMVFWLGIPVGAMVLLMIQYLTGGQWGVLLRRPLEAASRTLPLLALAFVPVVVLFFMPGTAESPVSPYWWPAEAQRQAEHPEQPHAEAAHPAPAPEPEKLKEGEKPAAGHAKVPDEDIQSKVREWLNPNRAAIGTAVYFAYWIGLMLVLNGWARKADVDNDTVARGRLEWISGPGLMAHAIVVTLAACDWVISLEPTWNSTMFPVILAVTQILSAYTFGVAVVLGLSFGPLRGVVKPVPHQIDLGSFMLALTLFWTYISFSQLLLVWSANLPEEIPFYLKRSQGGWEWVAGALAIFHFFLPFMLLLFRDLKSSPRALQGVAIGLLVMCAVDAVFWIEPCLEHHGFHLFPFMDVAALAAVGGLFGWAFIGQLKKYPLLPAREVHFLSTEHH